MLFHNFLKITKKLLVNNFSSHFVTCQQLYTITKSLINIDSTSLDNLCQNTLTNYQINSHQSSHHNHKFESKYHGSSIDHQIIPQQIGYKQTSTNDKNTIQQNIIFLYTSASDAQIGYLKGDIHSQFIFHLNQALQKKNAKQLKQNFSIEQYRTLLNLITQISKFRLPKKNIKNSEQQSKINLFQRQLLLQDVSNQLSSQKYQNILDTLERLGRIHLTKQIKKLFQQWFFPLCSAITDQQNKCKDQRTRTGKRKIYAQTLLKLPAQKLTVICLSQLCKNITALLYQQQNGRYNNEEHYFYQNYQQHQLSQTNQSNQSTFFNQQQSLCHNSIRYRTLCISLAKWVNIQYCYQQQQQQFKYAMKLYDQARAYYKKQRQQIIKKAQQQQQLNLQSKTPSSQQLIDDTQIKKFSKYEIKLKILLKQFKDKLNQINITQSQQFVLPSQRKKYLKQIISKMVKNHTKFRFNTSQQIQYQIGYLLIYLMKQILKIENKSGYQVPLMTLQQQLFRHNKNISVDKRLKIHDDFITKMFPKIQKQHRLYLHLDSAAPSIIQPLPWLQYQIGGYYSNPSNVMRFSKCNIQQRAVKYSDFSRIFNVLNYLGRTSWKINKKVLDVVQAIWSQGGQIAKVPKRYSQQITKYIIQHKNEMNQQKKKAILKKIYQIKNENSVRCDFTKKLDRAHIYAQIDQFYYPHNLDFRGRVYPIPTHLNHIGNDLSRGLLLFATGKKLSKTGLKWLKIHCANLMGVDKRSLEQKLNFIQSNLNLIHSIAQNPLQNRQWIKYDQCWQALGAIFELSQALKSNNPQQYISYIHVHQDGSCNGLQHYAALGRDTEGAAKVNLSSQTYPSDLYSSVAVLIQQLINQDILNKDSQNHELAKKLKNNIKRKTVKSTVMTSVYGVTFIGARQQFMQQLKNQNMLTNQSQLYSASLYLTRLTRQVLSSLFSNAHQIKKWLISCAKIIVNNDNPVSWFTPMGLPVVEPYRKITKQSSVSTIINELQVSQKNQFLPVDKVKQKSAFPPNFIHSLDSTHMMMTAQKCMSLGLVFAAVHDSYWTHASSIQQLNITLREQFVRLHSQPLLEKLKKSFESMYPLQSFPQIPKKGNFNIQQVKTSTYFFS